jgi:hypothetical protein
VIVDVRHIRIQPYGAGVTDEVNFMTAGGEFQAKLSGDDAACRRKWDNT